MEEFTLTIIGSGSALPMHGRHPSSQILQYGESFFMIDCGEGTQERLRSAGIKPFKIRTILISHLHGDHLFGLPGLLGSFAHLKRSEPLTIYGPPGIRGFLDAVMEYTEMMIPFPLQVVELHPAGLQRLDVVEDMEILTFPLYHRITCIGYLFREIHSEPRMRKELVEGYKLTPEHIRHILNGHDLNFSSKQIPASTFFYPPGPRVSYAYCSDTRYDHRLLSSIQGVSVLYYEATFLDDLAEMAEKTGHSTAAEAGKMAARAEVSCLLTGHYSSRYKEVSVLVEEARQYFGHVLEAVEGKKYNLRALAEIPGRAEDIKTLLK